jgi:hypothetical protein
MDNSLEVFAKPPNPISRPAYYTTASEVATREFVCLIIELRVSVADFISCAAY